MDSVKKDSDETMIFLSFRGAHTRYGFTGHVYEVLCNLYGECSQGWCTESEFEFIQRISEEISIKFEWSCYSNMSFNSKIRNCNWLQEILRLPQSIRRVHAINCLDPQSSRRWLNQKLREILGLLPDGVCECARRDILMDPQSSTLLSHQVNLPNLMTCP
ncbi:hypothetical protein CMV_012153 [Castanea mollissima]|uniref:Uncharacterized protein n=1 Tax=Castanea mollissima TaxID=60419 RepID=A0A8J4R1X9_9ROSI|nr:hypothetical protein CMV_012153 [Castanea mollissima]